MLDRRPINFTLMHCFTTLQDEPEWRNTVKAKGKGKGKAKQSASSFSEPLVGTPATNDEEEEVRPIGIKKAKQKRSREMALGNSNEELNKAMRLSLEEWSRSRKQRDMMMTIRSNDIAMSRNLSEIENEDELRYFTWRRKQIMQDMEKAVAESNSNEVVVVEENAAVQRVVVTLEEDEERTSSSHIDLVNDDVNSIDEE